MAMRYVGRPMMQLAAHDFSGTVRRALRNLRVFSGRDTRPQFWLYMAAVYGATQLSTFVFLIPSAISLLSGHDPFENGVMLASMLAMLAMMTVLLAAAITRRLHDTGRRGAWGSLPLPPLAVYAWGWWRLMRWDESSVDEVPSGFFLIWAAGLLYFAGIAAVIVLCVLPGTAGPNRYGPATAPPPPPPPPFLPPPPGSNLGAQGTAGGA